MLWALLFIVYVLVGLPLVARCGSRWPTWLNVLVIVAFPVSFVVAVACGLVALMILVTAVKGMRP